MTEFKVTLTDGEIKIHPDVSKYVFDPSRPFLSLRVKDAIGDKYTWYNYNLSSVESWVQYYCEK